MAQQIINIGAAPNDGSGDSIRVSFDKVNKNFAELYRNSGNVTAGTGYTGSRGYMGYAGSVGYSGSQGPVGPQGIAINLLGRVATYNSLPTSGNTVGDAWFVAGDSNVYLWDTASSSWNSVGQIVGYTGSVGAAGYTGSRGAGYTGSLGYQGSAGTIGYTGSAGSGSGLGDRLTNGSKTVVLGSDGTLTLPAQSSTLTNVNQIATAKIYRAGASADAVAIQTAQEDWINAELQWVDLRDNDATSNAAAGKPPRPWAGMPSYTAYPLITLYNPTGGQLPLPGNMAPTAKTASDLYLAYKELQRNIDIVAGNNTFSFENTGALRVPGVITKNNNLQLVSVGTTLSQGVGEYRIDKSAAVVADGENGKVFIKTNLSGDVLGELSWQFDGNGDLTLPWNGSIQSATNPNTQAKVTLDPYRVLSQVRTNFSQTYAAANGAFTSASGNGAGTITFVGLAGWIPEYLIDKLDSGFAVDRIIQINGNSTKYEYLYFNGTDQIILNTYPPAGAVTSITINFTQISKIDIYPDEGVFKIQSEPGLDIGLQSGNKLDIVTAGRMRLQAGDGSVRISTNYEVPNATQYNWNFRTDGKLTLPDGGEINDYVGSAGILGIFISRTFQTPNNANSANFGTDTIKILLSDVEAAEIVSYLTESIGVKVWFTQGNSYPITSCVQVSTGIWTISATGMGNAFATFNSSNPLIFIYTGSTPNNYTNFPQYVPAGNGAGVTISKSGNSWNFGTDGILTVPGNVAGNSGALDLNYDGSVMLSGIPGVGAVIQTTSNDSSNTFNWAFGTEGYTTFPGGGFIGLEFGGTTIGAGMGDDFNIFTGSYYKFGADGKLTLPNGTTINDKQGNLTKGPAVNSFGSNSYTGTFTTLDFTDLNLNWVVNGPGVVNGQIQSYDAVGKTIILNRNSGGPQFQDGQNYTFTGPLVSIGTDITVNSNSWTFGTDGKLTLPDGSKVSDGFISGAPGSAGGISNGGTGYQQFFVQGDGAYVQTSVGNAGTVFNTWQFGTDGKITLPKGSTIGETTTTTVIAPPGAAAGQSLVIRPTSSFGLTSSGYIVPGQNLTITLTNTNNASVDNTYINYTITGATAQQLGVSSLTGHFPYLSPSATNPQSASVILPIPLNSNATTFTLTINGDQPAGSANITITVTNNNVTNNEISHIHLVAGNPVTTDIYLGDDDQYVKIEKNHGNVLVGTSVTGIPINVANWNGGGGWNQGYYSNLVTTGGSGTGLTVNVAAGGGGYINITAITIQNPGTGYTDGDIITINNENNIPGTFTINGVTSIPKNWTFGKDGGLTFPDASVISSYKPVTVIAQSTSTRTIANNASAAFIQFVDTVDTANSYSADTFTVPYTGYYQVNLSIYFSTSVTLSSGSLFIDTNLDNAKVVTIFNGAWSGSYLHYSTVIPATTGDSVRIAIRQVSGASIDLASGCRLTIHRVSIS